MNTTTRSGPVQTPFLLLALFGLLLSACGGGGDTGSGADVGAGAVSVSIADNTYAPADMSVDVGGTVTWTNEDEAPHTVTFDDDGPAGSGQLGQGDSFDTTFDTPGTYRYVCAVHPDMTASVTVAG